MAASQTFVRALIRRAKKEANPIQWLESLQSARLDSSANGKVLIGSTVNGDSFSWQVPSDLSAVDVIEACEDAITLIENDQKPITRQRVFLT